jgi:hypothetical protein
MTDIDPTPALLAKAAADIRTHVSGFPVLEIARAFVTLYMLLRDFVRAMHNARHITGYARVEALLEIARAAKAEPVEMSSDLEAELEKL